MHPGVLLDEVCRFGEKYGFERTVDAHVARVRGKLHEGLPTAELIVAVHGAGHRLEAPLP